MVDADGGAQSRVIADPALPAKGRAGFQRDLGHAGRQDRGAILGGLRLEEFPAWQADDAHADAFAGELLRRLVDDVQLAACADEHDLYAVGRVLVEDVAALERILRRAQTVGRTVVGGQVLAREGQRGRAARVEQRSPPRLARFVGVTGPDDRHVGHGAQCGQVLDGLVRRAILAQTDAVVGEDVDDTQAAERRQADRPAHVVAKDQEGRAVGNDAAVKRHAVEDAAHAMLAHAEVDVRAAKVVGLDKGRAVDGRLVAAGQVGAAADKVGQHLGQRIDDLAAAVARGVALGRRRKDRQRLFPAVGQVAADELLELGGFGGIGGGIGGQQLAVAVLGALTAAYSLAVVGLHVVGNVEARLQRPAQVLLGRLEFLFTQRLAVHLGGAGLVWAAIADDALDADDTGPRVVLRGHYCLVDRAAVERVDAALNMPAVPFKALGPILGVGDVGLAVDGNGVIVVEIDDLAQAQMARQAGGLAGNAFHEVAVAHDGIGKVVDDLEARAVEAFSQPALGQRHAHAVGEAGAQRAGGRLDAHSVTRFGVAGRLAAPLAKALQLVQRQVVAGQMQHGVEQHGAVTGAEHEAVAVHPLRVGRAVAHDARPQRQRGDGHAHGHTGMARVGGLHTVGGEHANGVGGFAFKFAGKLLVERRNCLGIHCFASYFEMSAVIFQTHLR